MKRIFSVRTNIDELSASVGILLTDQEKAQWLLGYVYALQGGPPRDGVSDAFVGGYMTGRSSWEEAREHQEKSSAGGKKTMASHPKTRIDFQRQVVDPPPKDRPKGDVEGRPKQSLIVNPVIVNREIHKSNKPDARDEMDICSPSDDVEVSDADKVHMEKIQPYYKTLVAAGCKIGANSWPAWKRLVADYSLANVLSASKGIDAKERFADAVESALNASRGQANPGDAINPSRVIKMKL